MPLLSEIEEEITKLSVDEQLLLIERVSHRLRNNVTSRASASNDLSGMAADPEIQKEMRDIHAEFSVTEEDGLSD